MWAGSDCCGVLGDFGVSTLSILLLQKGRDIPVEVHYCWWQAWFGGADETRETKHRKAQDDDGLDSNVWEEVDYCCRESRSYAFQTAGIHRREVWQFCWYSVTGQNPVERHGSWSVQDKPCRTWCQIPADLHAEQLLQSRQEQVGELCGDYSGSKLEMHLSLEYEEHVLNTGQRRHEQHRPQLLWAASILRSRLEVL